LITVWKRKKKKRRESKGRHPLHLRHQIISFLFKVFFPETTLTIGGPTRRVSPFGKQSLVNTVQLLRSKQHPYTNFLPLAYTNWRSNEPYFRRRKVLISGPSIGQRTVDLPGDTIRYGTRARNWIWVCTQMNHPTQLYWICVTHMSRALLCFYASVGQRSSTTVLEGRVPHWSLTDSALLTSTANYRN